MAVQITFQYENADLEEKEVKAIYIGQSDGSSKKYVPEKKGKWVVENEYSIRCSECCFNRAQIKMPMDYCPHCGARMDGE